MELNDGLHCMCRAARLMLFAAVLLACSGADAQDRVSGLIQGRVTDAETGKPLEFVNIFLANTTVGTATRINGTYRLTEIPPGSYQLVASRVGFQVAAVRVRINRGDSLRLDFTLVPRVVRAAEVEVVAGEPSQWRRDLAAFIPQFLGEDLFAEQCKILNPEVLGFRHDSAAATMSASTDSIVRVENRALGYRLYVNLQSFSWRPENRSATARMFVRFEEMRATSRSDSLMRAANRKESYRGSLRHFLRSLVRRELESEAFVLFNEQGKPFGPSGGGLVFSTSMGYTRLASEGIVRIDFRGSNRVRINYVRFAMGIVDVHPDGYLLESQEFLIDPASDWAEERLSRLVPLNYQP